MLFAPETLLFAEAAFMAHIELSKPVEVGEEFVGTTMRVKLLDRLEFSGSEYEKSGKASWAPGSV